MQHVTSPAIAALALELSIALGFGFAPDRIGRAIRQWTIAVRLSLPALLVLPYLLVSISEHTFRWKWCLLYAGLPVLIAWLLQQAAEVDSAQRGNWRDGVILLVLGLAVDLRWFESAWPSGLHALGKILLVDAGLYGFLAIRQLSGTGFDFHLKWTDFKTGLRELLFFAPCVLLLGLVLGFIHPHVSRPQVSAGALRWPAIFLFIALPEELFFRAWVQNLLDRRVSRTVALVLTSLLFGLSHFNKRSAHFNWRYVLLATVAGIFYGRAWRERCRVPASAITHTCVDWIWSWWF